jgi:hypothetical protein
VYKHAVAASMQFDLHWLIAEHHILIIHCSWELPILISTSSTMESRRHARFVVALRSEKWRV